MLSLQWNFFFFLSDQKQECNIYERAQLESCDLPISCALPCQKGNILWIYTESVPYLKYTKINKPTFFKGSVLHLKTPKGWQAYDFLWKCASPQNTKSVTSLRFPLKVCFTSKHQKCDKATISLKLNFPSKHQEGGNTTIPLKV